jgi:uncharacterized protein DUF4129
MKTGSTYLRILLCVLAALAFAVAAQGASLSTSEYLEQLRQFSSAIEQIKDPAQAQAFEATVPDNVSVSCPSGECSFSYVWLKKDLNQYRQAQAEKRDKFLEGIQKHLQMLKTQAESYAQSKSDFSADHQKMNEILSRREFRQVRGPNILEIWLEKVMRAIDKFFSKHKLYGESGINVLHLAIYLAVAVAFSFFAIWIKRRLDRPREQSLPREIVPFAPSARGWRSWMAEARQCAGHGDWRNAIHLAYWAGISSLEERGAWRPDRARTPREYLRMLGPHSSQQPTLTALTRKFEVVWYGNRDADATDFQETLGQLEKLGCK